VTLRLDSRVFIYNTASNIDANETVINVSEVYAVKGMTDRGMNESFNFL
jgi:hypothetical protein